MSCEEIPLWIVDLEGDDPKKCSAKKLIRFSMAKKLDSIYKFPPRTVLLHPYANTALSPLDSQNTRKRGIGIIDCSWRDAERIFSKKILNTKYESRALPFLLAANPSYWGKPFRLSTLEAFCAALYITGFPDQAKRILKIYNWGNNFIELNKEILTRYSGAVDSSEIISIQSQYL